MTLQVALTLRSVQRGYIPDKSFVVVSFLATGVLLIGWRTALAAATQVSIYARCCHRLLLAALKGAYDSCTSRQITANLANLASEPSLPSHRQLAGGDMSLAAISQHLVHRLLQYMLATESLCFVLINVCTLHCVCMQNSSQTQSSQNKQGNPLEFLQLLASLTKRW